MMNIHDESVEENVVESKIDVTVQKRNFRTLALESKFAAITIFFTAIATGFAVYLAFHPELIWSAMNYPYAIGFVIAIPVSIFLLLLALRFLSTIKQFLQIQLERIKEDRKSYFFNFVIACFILVSCIESGTFFGSSIHNIVFGYATVLVIDMCAVQLMRSRKLALMHSDEKKANWYMFGVFVTAAVSGFANAYSSINNFDLPKGKVPLWMANSAPWVGVIFPMLIIFLAYTVDADLNNKGVVEKFEDEQEIKIKLLEAQERALTKQIEVKERLLMLMQRQSVFKYIFFTENKLKRVANLVQANIISQLQTETKQFLSAEIAKIVIPAQTYDDSMLKDRTRIIEANFVKLQEEYRDKQDLLEEKIHEYDEKLLRITTALTQWKQNLPQVIEAKIQELHDMQQYELVAERVFKRLIPEELESVIQIPQKVTVTEEVEEIDQEVRTNMQEVEEAQEEQEQQQQNEEQEEWNVARLTAKAAGYKASAKQCTIGVVRFAKFDMAATIFTSSKITEQALQAIYNQKLIPAKYFKVIEVRGFGPTKNDHVVIAVSPDTAQIQKMLLEQIKILKKNNI